MPPSSSSLPVSSDGPSRAEQQRTVQLGFSEPLLLGQEQSSRGSDGDHDGGGEGPNVDSGHELEWLGHRSAHYDDWDGGQIGGTPSWLDPQHVPSVVMCKLCQRPMTFVLQLYAPIDDLPPLTMEEEESNDGGNHAQCDADRAYHRTLYVFACQTCCVGTPPGEKDEAAASNNNCTGCVRVLRSQLPRSNPYYPWDGQEPNNNNDDWDKHRPETWKVHVCAVCGVRATKRCPQQNVYFCGPNHQKEYKRHTRLLLRRPENDDNDDDKTNVTNPSHTDNPPPQRNALELSHELPSLLPMSELVVEEEPPPTSSNGTTSSDDKQPLFPSRRRSGSSDSDDRDSDEDLEQEDLNDMVAGANGARHPQPVRHDTVTQAFYDRIQRGNGSRTQCLRYCRWPIASNCDHGHDDASGVDDDNNDHNHVLWLHDQHRADHVPQCENCGAHRRFEFQLMPQLLHYLQKKSAANGEDGPKKGTSATTDVETIKAAMEQADSWIQQAPPELVPPALVEAKANATKEMQQRLYYATLRLTLDWGVVAVYTCPNSCIPGSTVHPELGTCVEEFAWRQPPLDDK